MVNNLLVSLVNSVLGSGRNTARGNRAYHCPFCHHHKPKLEINFTENKKGNNPWHCWVCNKKGKTLISLFKQNSAPHDKILELKELVKVAIPSYTCKEFKYATMLAILIALRTQMSIWLADANGRVVRAII